MPGIRLTALAALLSLSASLARADIVITDDTARELWGEVCEPSGLDDPTLRGAEWGYRYNPLIVMNLREARNVLEKALMSVGRNLSPEAGEVAQARLDWVRDEDNIRTLAETLPPFWGMTPGRTSGQFVFFAPIFTDPYHACPEGYLKPVEDQYALIYGGAGPRVHGDLCAETPRILFGPSLANYQAMRLNDVYRSALAETGQVDASAFLTGDGLPVDGFRGKFNDALRMTIGIHVAQCGFPPDDLEIVWLEQTGTPSRRGETFSLDNMTTELRALVSIEGDTITYEELEAGMVATEARTAAEDVLARRRSAWLREARNEEAAAIGLLILGAMFAIQEADCDRPYGDPLRGAACPPF